MSSIFNKSTKSTTLVYGSSRVGYLFNDYWIMNLHQLMCIKKLLVRPVILSLAYTYKAIMTIFS